MGELGTVVIRQMEGADIDQALDIERASYQHPWTERIFRDELEADGRSYLVAQESERLVGFGGLMVVDDEAHVTTLAVDSECRGKGIGTRLMLSLVEAGLVAGARSLTLEVRVSNHGAQALYQRFGLAPVGVRKHYYLDEDALIMWAHDIHLPGYQARLSEIRNTLR